ncbi:hypothetical protein BXY66_0950 [Shimia isoporae]|uniref:Uncharacterized protein n=1 Tax=Shimia isoporae TaxID=647720 RepID=A0A4R1NMD5_9RHOB|nr:hypothetical protein [Shimia isoporae]TCL08909.1 hypothetical protein BXY66_0950 [Shimia isoporae]
MRILTGLIGVMWATGAVAQTSQPVLMTPTAPSGPACYYAGLAYSPASVVTVDVPFRRESPTATQKQLLKCVKLEDGETWGWEPHTME